LPGAAGAVVYNKRFSGGGKNAAGFFLFSVERIVVLISGRGSNLRAILDSPIGARVAAVISDNPAAAGLTIAANRGVAATAIRRAEYQSRDCFERALTAAIDEYSPRIIALAGFMRILSPAFVARYRGKLINIHPSLLPAYPGLDTHRRALAAGEKIHGCTIHWVSEKTDGGAIIRQTKVPVMDGDGEDALAARVLAAEHKLYPAVIADLLAAK
jgi:phosphoribosylglycinamide formyltransferase-1